MASPSNRWLIPGGLALIVGEFWHPEPPPTAAAFLALVARDPHWSWCHALQIVGVLLVAGGLAAMLLESGGKSRARWAVLTLGLGTVFLVVALALDGFGFPIMAHRATVAGGNVTSPDVDAFARLLATQGLILSGASVLLFGATPLLAGQPLAAARLSRGPRILGRGIGIVAMALGGAALLHVPLPPLPWYPLLAIAFGVWATWMGVARRPPAHSDRPAAEMG